MLKLPRGNERLSFNVVIHPDYNIKPARYAKGKVLVVTPGCGGWKTRAARLAQAVGGRWVNRETGYIMSPAAGERFAALYDAGADACAITGEIHLLGSEGNES